MADARRRTALSRKDFARAEKEFAGLPEDSIRDMQYGPAQLKYGSWISGNLGMANALKRAGYDFHFSFGEGSHRGGQGAVELPEELVWLWRDYDPSKSKQVYEQDKDERSKPPFRFTLVHRATDNWVRDASLNRKLVDCDTDRWNRQRRGHLRYG